MKESMKKATETAPAGFDLEAVKKRVLAIYPFFGSVAARLKFEPADEIADMTNDGTTLYYAPRRLADFPVDRQVFTLAHELAHVAFRHHERGTGKRREIWKAATDAVINQQLKRDGLPLPGGAIDYPEAIDYDAEEYYRILLAQRLDIDLEEELQEMEENLQGLEAAQEDDDSEEALIAKKVAKAGNAVRQDTRRPGPAEDGPGRIDWRMVLRDTVNYGLDWSMQHAVLEDGIVRPVLEEMPVPETEIVLDTSWSVDEDMVRIFLHECRRILHSARMKVGCFDTVFYGFQEIRTEEDIDAMDLPGGGGTDFNAAVGAFTMRVDNRIIFTDGQAPMPEMSVDAVWIVYGEETIQPPGGRVIHIPPRKGYRG